MQSALAELEIVPSIDLFASRLNAQLPQFVSYRPDRAAVALDAFSISWKNEKCFCCFPFQYHHTCSAEGTTGPGYRNPGCSELANRTKPQESWLSRTGEQTRLQEFWLFRIGEQDQATGTLVVPDWPTGPGHRSPGCPGLANRTRPQESWLSRTGEQTRPQESWLFRTGQPKCGTRCLCAFFWHLLEPV